ncbi:glycosyl hydrolase family protein [Actinidia rufa]|uniref:Glycosyl hydrolase family protein n=1 Tax=Actinidia rufa TaxID=165716 RepID=A0A7J0FSH3_9ERIC|nr:glycosyl hydrolase family protein [Actinidia rufa]
MPEKAVEFPESSQTHSTDFDGKVHEVQPPSTYSSEALSTEDLGSLTLENAWQSRERSEASPSCHGNSGKPEGGTFWRDRITQLELCTKLVEVNIIYENDQVVITNDDEDILEFIKDTYGEAHTLTKRETPDELSVLTTKSNVKQGEITEVNSGDLDNDHSNSPDYFDEEFKTPSVLGLDTTSDSGSSGDNSNSNDSIASVTQPAIMTEQGPNDASSSSSSTSVTEKKAPISQASLPIYDQITHTKVQQIEDSATYLCDDRNPGKLQGEHQTTMESYKPVEENVNLGSSEDLQKQVIGFSGVSQTFNGPIPSTMLPELVVEQVLMALSSSSSHKFDAHKMVSVEQASSYSIDPETQLKAEKSDENIVEINLSDKLLPENSAPPSPQNAQHLPSNSTAYPSYDKDLEELQEPSNSFQELNSIDSVKNSEVPANDENLIIIEDTNSEAQELAREENARVLSNMSEESISNLIDVNYIESQSEKMGENQTMLKTSEDSEGNDLKPLECDNTAETSYPVENNYIVESTRERDHDGAKIRASEVSLSPDVPIAPVMLIEVVVEPVPFATSSSSSPTSVLQQKFSIDQASVLSFEQDILMEIQQSETEMEESTTLNGLPFENSTGAVLQDALHVTEDPQEARIDPMDPSNVEGRSDGLEQMTDNGESMISKDIGDSSMPTNTKENLKATEVEGESKYLNANEANVVALAKPVEQNDDSNIPDLATADACISIEEASIISNENESVVNVRVDEDNLRSSVDESGSMLSGGGSLPFEKAQLSDWADMVDGYQKLALEVAPQNSDDLRD